MATKWHTFYSRLDPEAFDRLIYGRRPRNFAFFFILFVLPPPPSDRSVGRWIGRSSLSEYKLRGGETTTVRSFRRVLKEKKKKVSGGGDCQSRLRQQCETDRTRDDSGLEDVYLLVNRIRGRDFRIGFVTELLFAVSPRHGVSESRYNQQRYYYYHHHHHRFRATQRDQTILMTRSRRKCFKTRIIQSNII